jgi:hypothetical protein
MVGSVPFLLSSLRIALSAVRPLQNNYHFLCPITKSDVCTELDIFERLQVSDLPHQNREQLPANRRTCGAEDEPKDAHKSRGTNP